MLHIKRVVKEEARTEKTKGEPGRLPTTARTPQINPSPRHMHAHTALINRSTKARKTAGFTHLEKMKLTKFAMTVQ